MLSRDPPFTSFSPFVEHPPSFAAKRTERVRKKKNVKICWPELVAYQRREERN